ncbi:MAG: 2,3,4,5-tetrahydropyridine-2,6-dicarboxylate N-succinyltransferase, partial [Pseudomonadota bacterium]
MTNALQADIERAWTDRESLGPKTQGSARDAVEAALAGLDDGSIRVAEPSAEPGAEPGAGPDGERWRVHEWAKKAVLLSFRLNDMRVFEGAAAGGNAFDKCESKFAGWGENRFRAAGFRAVPGAIVRRGAHIGKGAVLMPSFVNIGARVGAGAMIDTWATVGSCAQIGDNVHLSGGAGIGGVLEPLQATPTIIEDDCFIGARSEVAEGVIVETGA